MTQETLAMTREDSDSRLMTRNSTKDSTPGKNNDSRLDSRLGTCDSGLDSRLDSHDSCTALQTQLYKIYVVDTVWLVYQ